MSATRLQVQHFLTQLAALDSKDIILSRQRKTLDFMEQIDYEMGDVVAELKRLQLEHYSYGPNQNDWGTGRVWHFGKTVVQYLGKAEVPHRVYIKLNLSVTRDGRKTTCMSFHPPEKPMKFPYKKPPAQWSIQ
ncbi:hypothetical protein [Herbaspirillum seropedicae]|uniref:hypothetical protein n=1 Tax=Herbaspirillum seropedicae TaxID=964 RepID=UPI003FCEA399